MITNFYIGYLMIVHGHDQLAWDISGLEYLRYREGILLGYEHTI